MGLLDDAIREHLELKRRRGADPTEIERAEREALGPVRRQPEPIQELALDQPAEFNSEPMGAAESEFSMPPDDEHLTAPRAGDWPEEEDLRPHGSAEPWHEEPAGGEPSEGWPHEEPMAETPPEHWEHEQPAAEGTRAAEPEPPLPPTQHHDPPIDPTSPLHQATEEYDVGLEREHEHAPPKEGDDMLEETPEFLQDTPDHDRLWFEQRPPRDFDFDD